MATQLVLLDAGPVAATAAPVNAPVRSCDWRLDDRTREVGRQGIAAARQALAAADRGAAVASQRSAA